MIDRRLPLSFVAAALVLLAGCSGEGGGSGTASFASSTVAGNSAAGATDGDVSVATFSNPVNVAQDTDGTLYVCDFDNNRVRTIKGNTVSTLVSQASFARPFGIVVAPDALYVSTDDNDTGGHSGSTGTIWKINKTSGVATVVRRNMGRPRGLARLSDGTLVASNLTRNVVSLINPVNGNETVIAGEDGVSGSSDGTGTAAHFDRAYGCTVLGTGEILVADQNNRCIRMVTTGGVVTTYAGTKVQGTADGAFNVATFAGPQDVKYDPNSGDIFVADSSAWIVRRLRGGQVKTVAGDGTQGFVEASGTSSRYYGLEGMGLAQNGSALYVADGNGGNGTDFNRIRRIQL